MREIRKSSVLTDVGDDLVVGGWMVTYDNVDLEGDKFAKGSISNLDEFVQKGFVFAGHNYGSHPLGVGYVRDYQETDAGVFVHVKMYDNDESRRLYDIIKERIAIGKAVGFSVGGFVVKERVSAKVNTIKEMLVKEVSLVAFPANERANVMYVKEREDGVNELVCNNKLALEIEIAESVLCLNK